MTIKSIMTAKNGIKSISDNSYPKPRSRKTREILIELGSVMAQKMRNKIEKESKDNFSK